VFNVGGRFYGLANRCPHMGAPVCKGLLTGTAVSDAPYSSTWVREGEILRCPWHAWEFDIATGETITTPVRKIQAFPVEVDENLNVWLCHDRLRDACDNSPSGAARG
jgi:3-phenylpropionate/trans-cinnamate dioxygenase ferredoxin subunit